MTTEVPIEQWEEFFENLSRDVEGWEINVEVLSDEAGSQVLFHGLPFHGLTLKDCEGRPTIELLAGSRGCVQSHTVVTPQRVSFEGTGLGPEGVLDIDDDAGARVLIKFVQPNPILLESSTPEIESAAAGKTN